MLPDLDSGPDCHHVAHRARGIRTVSGGHFVVKILSNNFTVTDYYSESVVTASKLDPPVLDGKGALTRVYFNVTNTPVILRVNTPKNHVFCVSLPPT